MTGSPTPGSPVTAPITRPIVDRYSGSKGIVGKLLLMWTAVGFVWLILYPVYAEYYKDRAETVEATGKIRALFDGSVAYFEQHAQFPDSHGVWPAQPSEHGYYRETSWDAPTWVALNFVVVDQHRYRFQYDATNHPTDPNQSTFTASAFGDLDGDGVLSTFVRFGSVSGMAVTGSGGLYIAYDRE